MIFVIGSGGSVVAGSWLFNTAATLPAIVTPSTILAITATVPGTKYAGKVAPESPAAGDVWFWIDDPSAGILLSDGAAQFKCYGAFQWDGTAWELLNAYVSWLGLWIDLPALPPLGTTLAACTWEQIDLIGQAGKGPDYFTAGETKPFTFTTGEVGALILVDFNHDIRSDGSGAYAPFTFHMQNLMADTAKMNGSDTNTTGWHNSAMRNNCNTTYFNALPTPLKNVVKQVEKRASAGNQSGTIITSNDLCWLLSEVEAFGSTTYSKSGEGSQYAYYTNNSRRIKMVGSVAANWWERSPNGSNATNFCRVITDGTANAGSASTSYGVALGLCV